jgi:hypothetical protein
MNDVKKYSCTTCKYSTNRNFCLEKHFASKKHIQNIASPEAVCTEYQCNKCEKYYKRSSGLWAHGKICKILTSSIIDAPAISSQESSLNQEILVEMRKMNEVNQEILVEMRQNKLVQQQTINNNNCNTMNNNFNMSIFLNDKCGNAINLEDFLKSVLLEGFEKADKDKMINSYIEGTCEIIQKSLEELPLNKRPMHYLAGEDPHQQLMHIREDNKWNTSSELNWMQQIHADDDDDVVEKNPIYYALKTIDDEKLKYLAYNFNQDKKYMLEHGRLHREISRPDFKEKVYREIFKLVNLQTDRLDDMNSSVNESVV